MEGLVFLIAGLFFLGFYFLPSLIAFLGKKSNLMAIFALNLLLGWTLVGWVVSLVWSLSKDKEVVVVRERDAVDSTSPD